MIASKDSDQYMLRLPHGLREQIKQRANENGRSINTEILAAIESHLEGCNRLDEFERRLAKLERLHASSLG
jgi:hypothetical protein